jgi:membrane protein YqaA with SNARE-associated domain
VTLECQPILALVTGGRRPVVLISGFLAAQGGFDLDALIVVIVSASIIGDSINYWLGRYVGRPYSIMSDGGTCNTLAREQNQTDQRNPAVVSSGALVAELTR